jgi:probable HAF family extracellular repeat protein
MHDLGTFGGSYSIANGINASGQIVGGADTSTRAEHAFLYSGVVMQDLNSLIPLNSGWILDGATGINDSGQICGNGTNPSGQIDAFLLTPTPIPEPSTLFLFGIGALSLMAYAWRRRLLCGRIHPER